MAKDGWDAIVVGAGLGGLTAAFALQEAGKRVVVLEASNRLGGRIVRLTRNGDSVEAGAQGIHTNYYEMFRLLEKTDLSGEIRSSSGNRQFLDRQGTPRTIISDQQMIKLVGLRGTADLLRYRTQYFTLRKRMPQFEIVRDVPQYDNVTAAEALSWAGEDFHDFVLRPQTHAQCGVSPDHVNLYHLVNMFRIRLTTKALGLSTGIVTLCERLAERLDVRYDCEVTDILTTGDKTDGVTMANGTSLKADHVILACPINKAAQIVPRAYSQAKTYLSDFTSTPLPLVFFFLDRPLDRDAYAFLAHAFQKNAAFNMALDHSKKTPYMVPSGNAVISAWPAYPQGAKLIQKSDSDIIAIALKDIEPMFPGITEMVDEARVQRHSWGFARYEPGAHRRLLDFKEYAAQLRGISFVGNDYDGVHMESAVRNGLRAAERAVKGL